MNPMMLEMTISNAFSTVGVLGYHSRFDTDNLPLKTNQPHLDGTKAGPVVITH